MTSSSGNRQVLNKSVSVDNTTQSKQQVALQLTTRGMVKNISDNSILVKGGSVDVNRGTAGFGRRHSDNAVLGWGARKAPNVGFTLEEDQPNSHKPLKMDDMNLGQSSG